MCVSTDYRLAQSNNTHNSLVPIQRKKEPSQKVIELLARQDSRER
jgi:hypothetical protein